MNCCDEYCSTYGCNQGRDCPVRVAKVGRKMAGPTPLPSSVWRYQLRRLGYWMLVAVIGVTVWPLLVYLVAVA